ncbi:MAG: AAA family ATPase [Candidatus Fermentibacteraceae bacterium]|nr:AAA family ATPase [Candidatus Fermentibacteraceae bacterium]
MNMLRSITLKNLATISDASMEFEKGLNVITGETGSGKSILVDGLMLAVGARADRSMVRPGAKTASVEAVFVQKNGDETVVRREISGAGRSRVFIDDALSTLEDVRNSVQDFVALHSQRSTPVLLKTARQLDILDTFAGVLDLRDEYRQLFADWKTAAARSEELTAFLGQSSANRELLMHEISLYEQLNPSVEDYNLLTERRGKIRKHMEQSMVFQNTLSALQGDDGVSVILSGLLRNIQKEAPGHEEISELLSQACISADEAANLLLAEMSDIDEAPSQISEIDNRLDNYSALMARSGGTVDSMVDHGNSLSMELRKYQSAEQEKTELDGALPELLKQVIQTAGELSAKRQTAAARLSEKVVAELRQLNMPHAQFSVQFNVPVSSVAAAGIQLGTRGAESAVFMFSANMGIPRDSLEAVASGGELSRVALALALVVADSYAASTLVFDEIDAGTGGETANNLAESLLRAASTRQVIVISHLAQIASRAHRHLAVTKGYSSNMPVTEVTVLHHRQQRISELARLLGGGPGAEEHAMRLLGGVQ